LSKKGQTPFNGMGGPIPARRQSRAAPRKNMNSKTVYSTKAEKYAKYRWDYAARAIETITEITRLTNQSAIADLGAGTGILTKHFIDKVRMIYAVEPNVELRQRLTKEMGARPDVTIVDGSAENTKLPHKAVDMITVAQAIHWFDPEPARLEIRRILKAGGWLVLLRNYATDQKKNKALGSLMTAEFGADYTVVNARPAEKPPPFYFGNHAFQKLTFPFAFRQNWTAFIGALTTASYMPNEDHPLFGRLETKAKEIFAQYSTDGYWLVEGETELILGQPTK
jgi:ubiquinone/menaquinone biosynthesis C-methylase UbiE